MSYRPNVGDSGKFSLLPPFSQYITPDAIYTCRSVRTINDIVAAGEAVYEKYYKPAGVADVKFKSDAIQNVCIIGLQAGTGEWVYVPDSFISEAPTSNGVKYIPVVIGANLGVIPADLKLDTVMKTISEVIKSSLGIDSEVKPVIVAQPALISQDDHVRINNIRQSNITNKKTDYLRVIELTNLVNTQQKQIKALEDYIRKRV